MTETDILETLEYNFGPAIMAAFADPAVLEIMLNDDGTVWIERFGQPMETIEPLPPSLALNVFQLLTMSPWENTGRFSKPFCRQRPSAERASRATCLRWRLPPRSAYGSAQAAYSP